MTSPAMRLLTLSLLLPLVTTDYVRQYVEAGGTEDQSIRVIRARSDPDKDPDGLHGGLCESPCQGRLNKEIIIPFSKLKY